MYDFETHRRAAPCMKVARSVTIVARRLMGMNFEEVNFPEHMALTALLACLPAISDELTEAGSGEAMAAFS